MMFMFEKIINRNKKAQGALEYLLIIGGAILIAIIAITIIVSLGKSNNQVVGENAQGYQDLVDNQIITPLIQDIECSTNEIRIYTAGSVTKGVSGYKYSIDGNAFLDITSFSPVDRLVTINRASNPLVLGQVYELRLVAIKNNQRSVATIGFDCKVS